MTIESLSKKLHGSKIAVLAHSQSGVISIDDELFLFLQRNHTKQVYLIKFPFLFSLDSAITITKYANGLSSKHMSSIKFYKPEILSYFKDFVLAIYYGFRYLKNTDLFIGMDSLFVFAGIILRAFGVVKKVAYYMIDFTPIRYKNPIINSIYYFIDRLACYKSDVVFTLNEEMINARFEKKGYNRDKVSYMIAPFGNNSDKYRDIDYSHYSKNKIAYLGGIMKSKGAELFVPIAQSLIKKGFNKFKFEIIGGGDLDYLKTQIENADLDSFFNLHGRVDSQEEVEKILLSCGVAIAPYCPEDKNSFSYYADAGKVKVYLGCGLPVVITDVPPIARIIVQNKTGVISSYDPISFANNVINILIGLDYNNYRHNALRIGRENSWNKIFASILDGVFSDIIKN